MACRPKTVCTACNATGMLAYTHTGVPENRTSPHITAHHTAHHKFMGITVPHITLRGPHITPYRPTNSRNRNRRQHFCNNCPVCGMRELCQRWHLCLYILISGDERCDVRFSGTPEADS